MTTRLVPAISNLFLKLALIICVCRRANFNRWHTDLRGSSAYRGCIIPVIVMHLSPYSQGLAYDCFIGNNNSPFRQKILNIAKTQTEPMV